MSSTDKPNFRSLLSASFIDFNPPKEPTITFLKDIYYSIMKRSFNKFNYFILQELIDIPLLIIEKIFNFININNKKVLSMNNFSNGIYELLFCDPLQKIPLLFDFLDFDKDGYVSKHDVFLILSHFHLYQNSDEYIPLLEKVIDNFFKSNDKPNLISKEKFINISSSENSDIVMLLQLYIKTYCCFFNDTEINFYISQLETFYSKEENIHNTNQTYVYFLHSSFDLRQYLEVIKVKLIDSNSIFSECEDDIDFEDLRLFEVEVNEMFQSIDPVMFPLKLNESYRNDSECFKKKRTVSTKKAFYKTDSTNSIQSPVLKKRELGLSLISKKTDDTNTSVSGLLPQLSINKNISDVGPTQYTQFFYRNNSNITTKKSNKFPKRVISLTKTSFPYHHSINEIYCYKSKNNFKSNIIIKLKLIGKFLFYFKLLNNSFQLRKIIPIFSLYPKKYGNHSSSNVQFSLISSVCNYNKHYSFFTDNKNGTLDSFIDLIKKLNNLRIITNFYHIKQPLGKGKFGSVSLCEHKLTGKMYAVKIINRNKSIEEEYKSNRWERSINMLLINLNNTNVIKCYDFFDDINHFYFIYEYVQGYDLKKYSKIKLHKGNCVIYHKILDISFQIISGLTFLHKYGIIHRDIKPSNIVINKKTKQVKIIDFGLSRVLALNECSTDPYGTLCFKAPELLMLKQYDFKVDIWAMGITLYYLMNKNFPFEKKMKDDIKKSIIGDNDFLEFETDINDMKDNYKIILYKLIKDCLEKNKDKRSNIKNIWLKYVTKDIKIVK